MPSGGTLHVSASNLLIAHVDHPFLRPGSYVCISVADTGSGIAPDVLPKIFDPYFTTRETGTGLGLSTCHAIVSRHNGHIEVESVLDKGTTFRVFLPAADFAAHDSGPPSSYPARGSGRVLVMDDDPSVREVASLLLCSMGYEVDSSSEGADAVARFVKAREAGSPFDVVIVDLTVPGGMGGKETLKRLLAIDPNARVVVASGYSEDPIISDYASAGFRAMITKPFLGDELARAVDKARC
jgi:CheY-like chemotaxis protein